MSERCDHHFVAEMYGATCEKCDLYLDTDELLMRADFYEAHINERDRYKAERDELIERLQGVIGLINEYFPESNPEVGILMIKRTLEINGLLKGAENVKVDCK